MKEKVKEIVSDVAEVSVEEIDESTDFVDDLEVDSMMALEIISEVEKEFNIDIPDGELPNFSNVLDLVLIIESHLEG